MQELSIVVEPLAYKGPPKLEPLKASPAEAPSQSEPTQLPAERCEDVYQHTAELPALVANEKEEEEVTRTPGMPRKLCLSTAVRRQPLHPAPKKHKSHPALIKGPGEDSSDEGWSSGGDTSGEPGSWAAPYMDLWSFRPANLYAERQLNRYSSTLEPHCALCLLFRPIQYSREETPREQPTVPESSAVWMPAVCFVNGGLDVVTSAEVGMPEIPDTDVKSSELLICTSCSVCVHK
ncbi:hypothetical protein MRX96_046065, partial [Rhipicephalus microplus]